MVVYCTRKYYIPISNWDTILNWYKCISKSKQLLKNYIIQKLNFSNNDIFIEPLYETLTNDNIEMNIIINNGETVLQILYWRNDAIEFTQSTGIPSLP
jgi:hypothetical protein